MRWADMTEDRRAAVGMTIKQTEPAVFLKVVEETRHPEKYRRVIAFSVAGGTARLKQADFPRERSPRFYLSAGTHEVSFRETAAAVAAILTTRGISHTLTERAGGHDPQFWNNELPEAVRWCFSADHPASARAVRQWSRDVPRSRANRPRRSRG